jgi:hypothetical protein
MGNLIGGRSLALYLSNLVLLLQCLVFSCLVLIWHIFNLFSFFSIPVGSIFIVGFRIIIVRHVALTVKYSLT